MKYLKSFKAQIYPTAKQCELIDKTIGCCRFVYNFGLSKIKENKSISIFDLMTNIVNLKKTEEFIWLNEVEAQALQQSLIDLKNNLKNHKTLNLKNLKYRKRDEATSFRTLKPQIISKKFIKLPKIGIIKTACNVKKKWQIKNATISKKVGKYFISFLIEYTPPKVNKNREQVGIDVGIKSFAVLSNGKEYKNLRILRKYEDRLGRLQRILSHTQKGSNNRNKVKTKLGRLYLKVANIRQDFLNKTSNEIAKSYSLVAIEDLNILGLLKNHKLSKSISDCSWGEFVRQLEYKCKWYNCELRKIGRFEPSSKLCSVCGYKMDKMPLNIREWTCPNCGTHHDRDLNASINILKIALSGREEEPVDTGVTKHLEQENLE